jgi:hypothetical protein
MEITLTKVRCNVMCFGATILRVGAKLAEPLSCKWVEAK